MSSLLLNYANHLGEKIHKIKCKYKLDNNRGETCVIN